MRSRFLVFAILIAVVCGLLLALDVWLHETLEFIPISITSSGKTVYFFAHQEVTQKITMEDPALITRLEVPWYPPTVDTPVVVEMHRYGKLVSRWHVQVIGNGSSQVLSLSLPTPQYIDGIVDISFIAPAIDHKNLERAPKVFLEPLDESFPLGNYRIGDEEKGGDIQMRLIAQEERIEVFKQDFTYDPAQGIARVLAWCMGLCLVAILPSLVKRIV